ncbi:MAG: hypothetical protein P8P99_02555 [Maricaulis sp.]|nr:hypothetical protein [Maricaulis sp.]
MLPENRNKKNVSQNVGTRSGRKNAITLRVSDDIYGLLVDASEMELVSLPAEAERRLRRTFRQDKESGNAALGSLLRYMSASSGLLVDQARASANKDASHLLASIKAAWTIAIDQFLPATEPELKISIDSSERNSPTQPTLGPQAALVQAMLLDLDVRERRLIAKTITSNSKRGYI